MPRDKDQDRLHEYERKRDFSRTPEPGGAPSAAAAEDEQRRRVFVIQKHDATRLHYDFRLEVEGVLKSWAVPKGPSLDPSAKHLAVMTEDHPLEYAAFEGVIPKGEYGGGPVIVWDGGTYRNLKQEDPDHPPMTMAEALADGHVTVWLEGEKLHGGFALIRTRRQDKKDNWLLIKMDDAGADREADLLSSRPESILSGKTIEDLLALQTPAASPAGGPERGG